MNIKPVIRHESFSGGLLVFAVIAAMILANSPGNQAYLGVLSLPAGPVFGNFEIAKPLFFG